MSIKAVSWALDLYIPDMAAKLVLVALADLADPKTGECFATNETLSNAASASVRTIQRKISQLADWGFVERYESFVNGRQRANSYRLRFDAKPLAQDVDEGCQSVTPPGGDTVVMGEGDTAVTLGGDTAVTPLKITAIETAINNSADEPRSVVELVDFEDLVSAYQPCDPKDNPHSARSEWAKLSDEDKSSAVDGAPAFCKRAQGSDFVPYLVFYLREKRWRSAPAAKALPIEWVEENSPRWREIVATGKKESLMRLQLRPMNGKQCFPHYPAAMSHAGRAA